MRSASMELAGTQFVRTSTIDGTRDSSGKLVLETPHVRFANPKALALNRYGLGPFTRLRLSDLPRAPGVYALVRGEREILYVGRARDSIANRWGPRGYGVIHPRNCFKGGQNTNCRLNALIVAELNSGSELSLWTHGTPSPERLEVRLIDEIQPPWNMQGLRI